MLARWLALLVLVPALALAGCAADPSGAVSVEEDFERGIRNWEKGADVPEDPNRPGENVSWSIDVTRERAANGDYSANFTMDGSQDDGTIWLVRGMATGGEEAYRANVTVEAWSPDESSNTRAYLVMHLGLERPQVEEDFPEPGENTHETPDADSGGLREVLDQQQDWKTYNFSWNVPAEEDQLWMALGISVVWETEVTYFLDDLRIELEPVDGQG